MSFRQSERFYCNDKDTVMNCPVGESQTQIQQVQSKQTEVSSNSQVGGASALPYRWFTPDCGCANCPVRCPLRYGAQLDKASTSGFLQNCGCGVCNGAGVQAGGSTQGAIQGITQGATQKAGGCGCRHHFNCPFRFYGGRCNCGLGQLGQLGQLGGCGCGVSLEEQVGGNVHVNAVGNASGSSKKQLGGSPVGAPLYIQSPAYEQLYPNSQNTQASGFPPLKYNFTPTNGVQFVPI